MAKATPLDLTPFEELTFEANTDEAVKKEIAEEKRVGFYKVKQKLGSGNFSEVKMGTHLLTKGKLTVTYLTATPKMSIPKDPNSLRMIENSGY